MRLVPKQIIIFVCGIPATRKSTLARYLAREHGFAHYDLECHPEGWPHSELEETWDTDRTVFLAQLRQHHDRIVLDWGFPVSCFSLIKELTDQGVKVIWFDGDVVSARKAFEQRGGISMTCFDRQIEAIQQAGYPGALDCVVVPALSTSGVFLDPPDIENTIFCGITTPPKHDG